MGKSWLPSYQTKSYGRYSIIVNQYLFKTTYKDSIIILFFHQLSTLLFEDYMIEHFFIISNVWSGLIFTVQLLYSFSFCVAFARIIFYLLACSNHFINHFFRVSHKHLCGGGSTALPIGGSSYISSFQHTGI